MTQVEIKLKDFETYLKDAKRYLKLIYCLNVSSILLITISALLTEYIVIGVFFGILILYNVLVMLLPNYIDVKISYKEAKAFYKTLFDDASPCSFQPMCIIGSYDKETLTYDFEFRYDTTPDFL